LNAPAISPLQAADESTPDAKERTRSFEHS
jgi:hypothetical protein